MDEKMSLFEELVNEQVEVLRNKLLTTFLSSDNFPESQDNISCVTMEQITDDTLITDDNESIISEACNICLSKSGDIDSFNFKLKANCECGVMGCFNCWEKFYRLHKREDTICCPKCRRDISGFLIQQEFKQIRHCSFCEETGHTRRNCSQRKTEEMKIRFDINLITEELEEKKKELKFKTQQLQSII
jgi:hypothetical protein